MSASLPGYQLGTFSVAGGMPFAALVVGGRAIALRAFNDPGIDLGISGADRMLDVLDDWDANLPRLDRAAELFAAGHPVSASSEPVERLRCHPPVDLPRQVFCIGANYRTHVVGLIMNDPDMRSGEALKLTDPIDLRRHAEAIMDQRASLGIPYAFVKLSSSIVGAADPVILPSDVTKPDWELELAVVIGRKARRVPAAEAEKYIAGYAIANDVTAREMVFRRDASALGADWLSGKCHPTFMPFGPYLVPRRFVPDPYALSIRLSVNGRIMQDESTADMMIKINRQIEFLSSRVTLLPGDVISTGSPAGNGSHHGIFLAAGDEMVGSITGLGEQRNRCVAESPPG